MSARHLERPTDCAMAIALPLSRRAFMRDLNSTNGRDLPRRQLGKVPGSTKREGWHRYRPVVKTARDVIRCVRRLGVEVVLDATVDNFADLLRRRRAVTFFSHHPFLFIKSEDILDASVLARHLSDDLTLSPRDGAEHLRQYVARVWHRQGSGQSARADTLAAALNGLIARDADFWGVQARGSPADDDEREPLVRVTRLDLELAYGGLIAEKSMVDFGDGVQPIRRLIGAVPSGFDGTLDLITCHSINAGEIIRRQRACGPNAKIATAKAPVVIRYALEFYRMIINELSCTETCYLEANTEVRWHLRNYREPQ